MIKIIFIQYITTSLKSKLKTKLGFITLNIDLKTKFDFSIKYIINQWFTDFSKVVHSKTISVHTLGNIVINNSFHLCNHYENEMEKI